LNLEFVFNLCIVQAQEFLLYLLKQVISLFFATNQRKDISCLLCFLKYNPSVRLCLTYRIVACQKQNTSFENSQIKPIELSRFKSLNQFQANLSHKDKSGNSYENFC